MERFWSKVKKAGDDECWIWQAATYGFGYGVFQYKRNGRWAPVHAHRVAWELTHGEIPDGLFVCHRCDNPPCVNPAHLFLGTPRQNSVDMLGKGRASMPEGVTHPRYTARLTEAQVLEIRDRWPEDSLTVLGREFGVAPTTIHHIVRRRTWTHI